MQWFVNWWEMLLIIQKVFACIAILATAVLVFQTILLFFGIGMGGDVDNNNTRLDVAEKVNNGAKHFKANGFKIFTARGFIAFFSIGGWLAVALLGSEKIKTPIALLLAFAGGFAALLLVAIMIKWSVLLQEK